MDWNIQYGTSLVSLVTTVTGDYNSDGSVDAADYIVWRKTLGEAAVLGLGADGDASGSIDPADYDVWRTNFGATAAVGAASRAAPSPPLLGGPTPAVPEPTTLWLALAWMAIFARLRHTHSRRAH